MLTRIADQIAESPRESLFVATVAVAAAALLVAFYLVCSGQVQRAELRDSTLKTQRLAVANCMDYSHKATLSSCIAQVAGIQGETSQVQPEGGFIRASLGQPVTGGKGAIGAMTPVSFSYR